MIKTVVFDFGGVLLDLDMDKTFKNLSEVMGKTIHGSSQDGEFYEFYIKYEKGEIKDETLLWNIQRLSTTDPHPRDIVKAWNAMLLGWNPERFEMLKSLRANYQLILLSNTNHMHISWVLRDLKQNHGIQDFENAFFDQVFYSHHIHYRKPDLEIYDYVTKKAQLDPSSTLFIDDSLPNIEGARQYGWKAQLHNPKNEIVQEISSYLKGY